MNAMNQEEGRCIKISALILCLITCVALNGCTTMEFMRKEPTLEGASIRGGEQPEEVSAPVSKGYLAGGATIKMETDAGKSEGTIIEQFEKTSLELESAKENAGLLKEALEEQKLANQALQEEILSNKEKLAVFQQLSAENESLNSEVERLNEDLADLQKQYEKLKEELLAAQISEIKIKQELVNARIQHLKEKKKLQKKIKP